MGYFNYDNKLNLFIIKNNKDPVLLTTVINSPSKHQNNKKYLLKVQNIIFVARG